MAQSAPQLVERNFGPLDPHIIRTQQTAPSSAFTFSPNRKHLAYWCASADHKHVYVVRDGVPGRSYDVVVEGPANGITVDTLCFSPDGAHLAYRVRRNDKWSMVVDGIEGDLFETVSCEGLHFSADSSRIAYWTTRRHKNLLIVVDTKTGRKLYSALINPIQAFPYGHDEPVLVSEGPVRVSASDPHGQSRNRWVITSDGSGIHRIYDRLFPAIISPDHLHISYLAKLGNSWTLLRDGVEGPFFDSITDVVYSLDSQHLAYKASLASGDQPAWYAVVDDKPWHPFGHIDDFVFSPNCEHLAFLAEKNQESFIVVDGSGFGPYTRYDGPSEPIEFVSDTQCRTLALQGKQIVELSINFDGP